MSLSKECQEYHLTHRGWIGGSFKGDALGGSKEVEPPSDRVLTIGCYDKLSSAYSEPSFYEQIHWKADDENSIDQLIIKYGDRPDWFGYKKMKK